MQLCCIPIDKRVRWIVSLLISTLYFSSLYAGQFSGSLAVTSDYVYRGVSQTHGEPAIQGGIQYATLDHWALGVWASTTQLNTYDGTTIEVDPYVSFRWNIRDEWHGKLSALHYFHPLNSNNAYYEYDEVAASVDYNETLFFNVAWSWNVSHYSTWGYVNGNAISYEASWARPLPKSFSLSAGIGYYDLSDLVNTGYWYWNAGVGKDWEMWHLALSYIGTSQEAEQLYGTVTTGNRFSITLLRRF
jgi:uncharacterized protein (TIGR02001 family)